MRKLRSVTFAIREVHHQLREILRAIPFNSEARCNFGVALRADEPPSDPPEITRFSRSQLLDQPRKARADILHAVIAFGLG